MERGKTLPLMAVTFALLGAMAKQLLSLMEAKDALRFPQFLFALQE